MKRFFRNHILLQIIVLITLIVGIAGFLFDFASKADVRLDGTLSGAEVNVSKIDALTENLIGVWSLDGPDISGTTAYDRSGNGLDGTLTNSPTPIAGKIGQALSFSGDNTGTNQYVNVSHNSLLLPTALSVSVWFKTGDSVSLDQTILRKLTTTSFSYDMFILGSDPKLRFRVEDDLSTTFSIFSNTTLSSQTWYHAVGTMDSSGNMKLYLNGVLQTQTASGASLAINNTSSLRIGATSTTSHQFLGRIDDVRIYSSALSSDEVGSLYQQGAGARVNAPRTNFLTENLIGVWSLDGPDISGTTAYDRSGNGLDGTLTNSPTPIAGKIGQALSFSGDNTGTNQYVNVSHNSLLLPTALSVSVWFKTGDSVSLDQTILRKLTTTSFSYDMFITGSDPKLRFRVRNDSATSFSAYSNTTLSSQTWYHAVGTMDSSGNMKLYLNGVLQTQTASGASLAINNTSSLRIGATSTTSHQFLGRIDDVRIYSSALSSDEVTSLYQLGF